MFKREYLKKLTIRMSEPRKFIQVLAGPRQIGKTTMINQLFDEVDVPHVFESADSKKGTGVSWIAQVWDIARIKLKSTVGTEVYLAIDEIQKIDNWSEEVKLQWDYDSKNSLNIKVILLGSSRMLLQQGLSESLAGRFELINVTHWSFKEMHDAFGIGVEQFMWFGGYPGSVDLMNDEIRWKSYIRDSLIETSISKDILMLTRVAKPALLKKLFEIGTDYSGQILSYNKILGQLNDAGNTTTLAHYLDLLSESGLLGGIFKFAGNISRKKSSSPKFQVYNNALLSALKSETFEDVRFNYKAWGRIAESSVGAYLISNSLSLGYKLYYWRDNDDEVDFVLEKGNKIVSLEVKSGSKSSNKGIQKFKNQFNPSHSYLVGTGGIPIEEFLQLNPDHLF